MSQADDVRKHALRTSSMARSIGHPRTADRPMLIRELCDAINERHQEPNIAYGNQFPLDLGERKRPKRLT